jgi:methyl-accepting chemotaxis protein
MKITNLKISTRLSLGFALLLTLMVVMTVVGILRLQQVGTSTQVMADTMLPKERLAQEWLSAVDVNGARTLASVKTTSAEDQAFFQKQMEATSTRASELQKIIEGMVKTPEDKRLIEAVGVARNNYRDIRQTVLKTKASGQIAEAQAMINEKMLPAMEAYSKSIDAVLQNEKKMIDEAGASIQAAFLSGRSLLIGLQQLRSACSLRGVWLSALHVR